MPDDTFWTPFFEFISKEFQNAADGRGKLDGIVDRLKVIKDNQEKLMAAVKDINDLLDQMDQATTEVATELQKLMDELSGGVSATDAEAIKGRMVPLVTRLQGMGKDPNNPVPPVTPPTEPPTV
jgi:predicted transcriptional regulator